jgi:hypothetical protein
MNNPKHFFLFILISSFSLLTSCGAVVTSKANNHITVEKGAIPPDFGNDNSVLVFITHHRSYNKYLKKNVEKMYKGKFEYATEKEFESNEKYKDIEKYRYVFDYSNSPAGSVFTSNPVSTRGSGTVLRPALFDVKRFSVVDRKAKKVYSSNLTSSFWSKIQKVYLKKLNEKRISNSR